MLVLLMSGIYAIEIAAGGMIIIRFFYYDRFRRSNNIKVII
jgi:hypothetical protein